MKSRKAVGSRRGCFRLAGIIRNGLAHASVGAVVKDVAALALLRLADQHFHSSRPSSVHLLTRMLKRNPPRLKAATLKLRRSGTPERARPEPMPLEQARRPSHNVKRAASRSSRQPTARLRWAGTIRRRSVTLVAARQFTALAATADRRAKRDVSEVPHSVFDLG